MGLLFAQNDNNVKDVFQHTFILLYAFFICVYYVVLAYFKVNLWDIHHVLICNSIMDLREGGKMVYSSTISVCRFSVMATSSISS